jgi:hypothetical protein
VHSFFIKAKNNLFSAKAGGTHTKKGAYEADLQPMNKELDFIAGKQRPDVTRA